MRRSGAPESCSPTPAPKLSRLLRKTFPRSPSPCPNSILMAVEEKELIKRGFFGARLMCGQVFFWMLDVPWGGGGVMKPPAPTEP